MPTFRSPFLRVALAGALAALAGCGSDSTPASSGPSATGTLTDSPIAGVSYTTSGGFSGTTDSDGKFKYNPGETVTFRIGGLTLGTVTATGTDATITPLLIAESTTGLTAAEKQNLTTNLLVLLQSLDSDGDPSNGIGISTTAATALTTAVASSLNLATTAPATFADSSNSTLTGLLATAGVSTTPVSADDALAHFRSQFMKTLAGTYVVDTGSELIAFRFQEDGDYLMGEVDLAETDPQLNESGIERGSISWDPQTGEIAATIDETMDTNGERGLSHMSAEKLRFAMNGSNLVVSVADLEGTVLDTLTLQRVANGSGVLGPWALSSGMGASSSLSVEQLVFLGGNKYLMLDPTPADQCGGPGLEYGSYGVAGNVLSFSANVVDTNGCRGLHDSGEYGSATFSIVNSMLNLTFGPDDSASLVRPVNVLIL